MNTASKILKPCPCCGGEVHMYVQEDGGRGEFSSYQVECSKCKLSEKNFSNDGTRRSAIRQWNQFAEKPYVAPTQKVVIARNL